MFPTGGMRTEGVMGMCKKDRTGQNCNGTFSLRAIYYMQQNKLENMNKNIFNMYQ